MFDLKKWASSFCIFRSYCLSSLSIYRPTPCGENSLVICHLYGFPMHLSSCNLPFWLTNLAIIHIFQLPLVKRKKCLVPHMTNCSCECDCECECNCNGNCNTECNALSTRNQRNFSNFSGISHSIANGTQSVPRIYSRLERYRYEMAEAKQTANQNTKQLTWLMYIYKQKHGEKANFFAQKKPIIMKMNLKLVETAAGSPARSCETMRRILKNWEKPAENDSSCSRDYNLFSWLLFLLLLHLIIRFGKCFAYCFRFRFHRILCFHFFCRVYFLAIAKLDDKSNRLGCDRLRRSGMGN